MAETLRDNYGEYILAVEGNPPLAEDGMFCIVGGRPFIEQLQEMAAGAKAVVAWGSCASNGWVWRPAHNRWRHRTPRPRLSTR